MNRNNQESLTQNSVPPKLLISNHITSTNAVIDVFQTDYSDGVRSYRVHRREPLGQHTPIVMRLLSLNDMILLALLLALMVPSLPSFLVHHKYNSWISFLYTGSNMDSDFSTSPISSNSDSIVSIENINKSIIALPINPINVFSLSPRIILLFICFFIFICRIILGMRRAHTEEVTAIRGLGMQLTSYNVFGRIRAQRFIELQLIRSLIIHDAYFRCQAIFFLSATVENEAERLVVFEETLPRLIVLRLILRGLRHILYEEPELGASLAELEGNEPERFDESVDGYDRVGEEDSDVTEREYGLCNHNNHSNSNNNNSNNNYNNYSNTSNTSSNSAPLPFSLHRANSQLLQSRGLLEMGNGIEEIENDGVVLEDGSENSSEL